MKYLLPTLISAYMLITASWQAITQNTFPASGSVSIGKAAGNELNDGHANVFIGILAGMAETNGDQNMYVCNNAGINSDCGSYNVAVGTYAGNDITTNTENVFVSNSAGFNQASGNNIVAVGSRAGDSFSGNQS